MSDIMKAPAPWKLKGQTWSFVLSGLSKASDLPSGFADSEEAEVLSGTAGKFIGGFGLVMVVRYDESPVGPYDELIYIPGKWKYEDGKSAYRVTRIYVSSKESVENGRRNWNIPKHVADFKITSTGGKTTIIVSNPGSDTPFFHATASSIPLFSRIPLPAALANAKEGLVQPPLPAGNKPEEVGTKEWVALVHVIKGAVKLFTCKGMLSGKVGDGVSFPALVPWSVGLTVPDMNMEFPEGTFSDTM